MCIQTVSQVLWKEEETQNRPQALSGSFWSSCYPCASGHSAVKGCPSVCITLSSQLRSSSCWALYCCILPLPPPSCQHMYISRLAGSLVGMRSSSLEGLLVDTCHASSRFTSFLCFLGLDVPQPTQLPPVDKNSLGSQFVCGHQQCCNKPLTV